MKSLDFIWRNYNLSIILFFLFIVSWILQTYTGWIEFKAEELNHSQTATVFGDSGYIWAWLRTTMENWQSEFLQLLTFVSLTSIFIHRGSPESKDGDDEMKATLKRIEHDIKQLKKS